MAQRLSPVSISPRSRRPSASTARRAVRPEPAGFQELIDSLADGVVVANAEGRLLMFNAAAERMLGPGLAYVPFDQWSARCGCYRPDMRTRMPSEELPLARALRGEAVDDCEIYVRREGGADARWISVSSRPRFDAHGQIAGAVATVRDITTQRRQLERHYLMSRIVEETADAVLVTDSAGSIEYVNAAFERTTGYLRSDVLGETPRILKSGEHARGFYEQLWAALLRGDVFRDTFANRRKDGDIYFSSQTITPLKTPDGVISHLVSIGRDVTELRKAAVLENSLLLARQVQQRLCPTSPPRVEGLDAWGVSRPAHATGGDYFDFLSLPGGSLGLVVGDVSGHGFDSAILMAQTRALVRAAARGEADPARILSAVHALLVPDLDDDRFVGMMAVQVDPHTRSMRWANAGHAPGYVLDRDGHVRVELASTGMVLGLADGAAFATGQGPALEHGDLLVLLTDGVTEAEAPDGTVYGSERALDLVRLHADRSAEEILEALCRSVQEFIDGADQQDDVTAVVCRVVG